MSDNRAVDARTLQDYVNRRAILRAGLLGGVALGVAACGVSSSSSTTSSVASPAAAGALPEPSQELIEAAQKEGEINVYYAAPPDVGSVWLAAFTRKYGITVNGTHAISSTAEVTLAAQMAGGKPVADVFQSSDSQWITGTAIPKGYFVAPDPAAVPAVKTWPASGILSGMGYLADVSLFTIQYNTNIVKPGEISTWNDVLNPKYKGLIILIDPRDNVADLAFYQLQRQNWGDAWLEGLAKQEPQLTVTGTAAANVIAAGGAAILIPGNYFSVTSLLAAKAPIGDVTPPGKTSVTGVEQYLMLVKDAPHPNAAQLFMNYSLSAQGQSQICGSQLCTSMLNAPGTAALPRDYAHPPIDEAVSDEAEIVSLLGISGKKATIGASS
jgi:iron(III) transport system substrate-binding protein